MPPEFRTTFTVEEVMVIEMALVHVRQALDDRFGAGQIPEIEAALKILGYNTEPPGDAANDPE